MTNTRCSVLEVTVGAAVRDITPATSAFLYGYPHVPQLSTGVHDSLESVALYIRRGDSGVLFVANDLIWITRKLTAAGRRRIQERTGMPEHCVMITATHSHSGPVTSNQLSNSADPLAPADRNYLAYVEAQIVDVAVDAIRRADPAEIGLAIGVADRLLFEMVDADLYGFRVQ
jgi:neutral ceramidase